MLLFRKDKKNQQVYQYEKYYSTPKRKTADGNSNA